MNAKPVIKWVGGKGNLLPLLISRQPTSYDRYIEQFVGGGALFFALQPKKAYLSDLNSRLIITYQVLSTNLEGLIDLLSRYKKSHTKEQYLRLREELSTEQNPLKIAATFIYLNKTCFNGLYRVNRKNEFNVPMGNYTNPAILDEANLRLASEILQKATIRNKPFGYLKPSPKDFFYFDPPYHETFSNYSEEGFSDTRHIQLANYCDLIHKTGAYFMLSNSDTPLIRNIFRQYEIEVVEARRSISCKSTQRGKEHELLIRNY